MSHKIMPFRVDYIVKNDHIDTKFSKIIQRSEIFLQDTDEPLQSNLRLIPLAHTTSKIVRQLKRYFYYLNVTAALS